MIHDWSCRLVHATSLNCQPSGTFLFAEPERLRQVTKNNVLPVLQAIGDLSGEGILLFSVDKRQLDYTNEALIRIFDITHETFRHEPAFFINHIPPGERAYLKNEFEKLLHERKIENVEFMVMHHDRSIRNVSCNGYVIENGAYIIAIFRDITVLREHENYIINYGAKKDTLLEMVTHNLSGPLSLSQKMVESLEKIVNDKDLDRINTHVQLIRENTRHCIELVNDFLEEEHLVSEQIQAKKNRFDVISKVNTVIERFRKAYPDYDFLVLQNFNSLFINNDDVKFLQVLNNLISNAIKWSPSGSVIEINIKTHNGTCTLTVRDHGIGIPEDLKSHIFQKNTPAGRDGLRGEKSTGMGLYIVKKLVNLMNGTITFESQENDGTTFILTLPNNE